MLITALLIWLLYCATQSSGIIIEATPAANSDGFIHSELKETVSLTCKHETPSEAEAELVWLRNDSPVALKEENKKGESRICISPVIHEDKQANFTCHLRSNASVRASVILNVTYPPPLSESEDVTVEEESTLVLRCNILASPPVSSVAWALNGSEVDLLTGLFTITNDGSTSRLSTGKVQRSLHEGTYQCTAESPLYGQRSKEFRVSVKAKTTRFPLLPMIAGLVVVCLTSILAVVSRWEKIVKCCK